MARLIPTYLVVTFIRCRQPLLYVLFMGLLGGVRWCAGGEGWRTKLAVILEGLTNEPHNSIGYLCGTTNAFPSARCGLPYPCFWKQKKPFF